MGYLHCWLSTMSFSARLIALRKQRYQAGHARSTAEAQERLVLDLHAIADAALFEEGKRDPTRTWRSCSMPSTTFPKRREKPGTPSIPVWRYSMRGENSMPPRATAKAQGLKR